MDSVRGASAFVDACRSVRALETMSIDEADQAGINPLERKAYFKEFNGKLNFSPPFNQVKWRYLHNIEIDNGGHLFGDEVGAVALWVHPGTEAGNNLTQNQIDEIKRVVSANRWRESSRAEMWVGRAIAPVLGITGRDKMIKAAIKRLLELGILKSVAGRDESRRERMFIVVGDEPAPVIRTGAGFEDL